MSDSDQLPLPDQLAVLLHEGTNEETLACLDRLSATEAETRKRALRAVQDIAVKQPRLVEELVDPLSTFLTDEDRAVRLTTAKLFVALAQSEPTVVLPAVDVLADRLADEDEFYYVRARCAEALGYVAIKAPKQVTDPDTLADLRIGLEFDEPEVKMKLAKALVYVALGDASRLRHQISSLAAHLDDENELVRYHLCTALVVVGCEDPTELTGTADVLRERLADENSYVRGRAAEALGLLAGTNEGVESDPVLAELDIDDDSPLFLSKRVQFCRRKLTDEGSGVSLDGVGTIESVRDGTDNMVEEMKTPDDGECPHCGLDLPESGPPMCPRCGTPR
ncbi:hypothetical protein C464_12800 [Halorubrum coriense DSM 10284]|uniref:Condensin complex subunit 1 C-terminal domain-containing protein n=1 Tax=Halorubrum coriense DSM 10284 TaxID=1227466 RepID=M0EBI9_9EURY|nr:HEAT repeat domain-containing protein [Halorubrum coriense]ELZ45125.1 hypothetical protein C464_12800 [Halorubrum coriense DSM 10284]